jgi:hypothetical protein
MLQNIDLFLLPLSSKRATFYINLHGQVGCFVAENPAGAKRPDTFLRSGLLSIPYTYKQVQ